MVKETEKNDSILNFVSNTTKDEFIYTRIEASLLNKIKDLQERKKITNRSQAIRAILQWAFANGVDQP